MSEPAFIGREADLARLQGFLDQALAGQGTVALVAGEAGSGKSTLLEEFARRAQQEHENLVVALGRCNAHDGQGDPFLPFREVLRLLTGDVQSDLAGNVVNPENVTRIRKALSNSFDVLLELTPDLVSILLAGIPLAGFVVGAGKVLAEKAGWMDKLRQLTAGHGEKKEAAPAPTEMDQGRIHEQFTLFLTTLASRQPILLVLDDLQWADSASIGLLFHLYRSIERRGDGAAPAGTPASPKGGAASVLIVAAYRPDEIALGRDGERHPLEKVLAEVKRYRGDVCLDLDQTSPEAGRAFVDRLLDQEPNNLDEEFRQAFYQRTEGHPLFAHELLNDLKERGDIERDGERWVASPTLDWDALPARIEGVIGERLGRLDPELRELLTAASVEGETFTAEVLARVRGGNERQMLRQLSQELDKRHGLIREQGEVKVGREQLLLYQFTHALFQRYLYNEMSSRERRLLHGDIAAALEELYAGHTDDIPAQLARHYSESGEGEKAASYLLKAGDRARALSAPQEAIDLYRRALAFLKEQHEHEQAARTLMKLGLTYHLAFDFSRSREAYEEGFLEWQYLDRPRALTAAPHGLRINSAEPATLDPGRVADLGSLRTIDQLFAGLVELGPALEVTPGLAESWEVLEGGQEYVFHLRPDLRWSDGAPLTAADFEFAWKRVLDPATGSPGAGLLYDIRDARAYHQTGDAGLYERVGVHAVDARTLAVELEAPSSYFPQLMALPATYPVPRHAIERHGDAWTEPANLVVNGPFRLERWDHGQTLVLVRNPEYGEVEGNVERVETLLTTDLSGLLPAYEAGQLDIAPLRHLPPVERDRMRQRHSDEYVSAPALVTMFVAFDLHQSPLDDARVRQALVRAVDREALANVVLRGFEFPGTGGFVPPGMPGHSAGIGLAYDRQAARQLLAEAGFPGGRGLPALHAAGNRVTAAVGEFLATQWRQSLGVEVQWQAVNAAALQDPELRRNVGLLRDGWVADYPDPDNYLRTGVQQYAPAWQDQQYLALTEQARRAASQSERMRLYQQADRLLIEQAVLMPLTYSRLHLLVKPWVRNLHLSAVKYWGWKDVVIEEH